MAIRAHSLFLVWHIVQCAGNQCSDSMGTCSNPPRASLMQTKSMKKQALSAVESASTRTQTLAGYTEYVNSLVETYKKGGQPIEKDSDIDQAITTIISYINSMYADLLEWHKNDVEETVSCATAEVIRVCTEKNLDTETLAEFESEILKVDGFRQSHKECRENCNEDRCGGDVTSNCKDYHHYRKTNDDALYTAQVACANSPTPPGHLSDDYIGTNDDDKREDMESCLQNAKDWLDPLYELYSKCNDDITECPGCQSDCDKLQADFENAHCQHDIFREGHCTGFDTCYKQKKLDCDPICARIETRSNARRADNETGEIIKCLLNVLKSENESKADELEKCNTISVNTSFWNIDCTDYDAPDVPPHGHACGDVDQPCQDPFLNLEYKIGLGLDKYEEYSYEGSYNMIGPCTSCNGPTYVWNASEHDPRNIPGENN